MNIQNVIIAAVFVNVFYLAPVSTKNTNEEDFHLALESLHSSTEECLKVDNDRLEEFKQAISNITTIFYNQRQFILSLKRELALLTEDRPTHDSKGVNNPSPLLGDQPRQIVVYGNYLILNDKHIGKPKVIEPLELPDKRSGKPNEQVIIPKSSKKLNDENGTRTDQQNSSEDRNLVQNITGLTQLDRSDEHDELNLPKNGTTPPPDEQDGSLEVDDEQLKLKTRQNTDIESIEYERDPMGLISIARELTEKEKELAEASKGTSMQNKIVELCAEGIDPNIGDVNNNNLTAIHVAAISGAKLETLMLLRCGANPNIMDGYGNTPLHIAIMKEKYWVSMILLLNNANPFLRNNKGYTPQDLSIADIYYSTRKLFHENVLEWFSTARSLNIRENELHDAVKKRNYLGIIDICMKGVDVNVQDRDHNKNTALHLAVISDKSNEETVLAILHCGANINAQNGDGNTALHLAIIKEHVNVTITLLINRADPFIPNNLNKTAYQLGTESKNSFIADTFCKNHYNWYMNHLVDH